MGLRDFELLDEVAPNVPLEWGAPERSLADPSAKLVDATPGMLLEVVSGAELPRPEPVVVLSMELLLVLEAPGESKEPEPPELGCAWMLKTKPVTHNAVIICFFISALT